MIREWLAAGVPALPVGLSFLPQAGPIQTMIMAAMTASALFIFNSFVQRLVSSKPVTVWDKCRKREENTGKTTAAGNDWPTASMCQWRTMIFPVRTGPLPPSGMIRTR
jgi:hypothetical protein